jgi:glycosyltransferase involved in cell wall biosynthesis
MPKADARAKLGWDQDEKIALFFGNPDIPRKNFGIARGAVDLLNRDGRNIQLKPVWSGPQEEVPLYMNAADCLVFPSLGEGSPNAIKEAMACELPIVSSPVGDVPERFEGVEGCVIADRTVESFAKGLVSCIDLGRLPDARQAAELVSMENIAERVVCVYEEMLAEAGRPAAFLRSS